MKILYQHVALKNRRLRHKKFKKMHGKNTAENTQK